MPPHAILYLLSANKKWDDNKASMEDFLDFDRMRAGNGMETINMEEFLETAAVPGLLSLPLPKNNTKMIRQPLWDYLESASYVRQWSPGKTFISFNISSVSTGHSVRSGVLETGVNRSVVFGDFRDVEPARLKKMSIDMQRQLVPYTELFHSQRAVFFPGHDANRLLTLWYTYFFFAEPSEERAAKRYMRDRVRYHDSIFCAAGRVIDLILQQVVSTKQRDLTDQNPNANSADTNTDIARPLVSYVSGGLNRVFRLVRSQDSYIAFHIRRGDFQQKHTRLSSQEIVDLTLPLIPGDPKNWLVYISTDEGNRTFFEPFVRTFKSVRFLSDYNDLAGIQDLNQNHLGMVEQVVCANAHTFIGTPLSTFTSYITRMRGYMDRSTLVESEDYPLDILVTRLLASHSRTQGVEQISTDKQKRKNREKKIVMLSNDAVRIEQLGRPVVRVSDNLASEVGKVYERESHIDVSPYGRRDGKAFHEELFNNTDLFLRRFYKTTVERPDNTFPFITQTFLSDIKTQSSKVVDNRKLLKNSDENLLAVGMYARTYYYMGHFMYQLHDRPHFHLPFWVREFSEPFEDTEELSETLRD